MNPANGAVAVIAVIGFSFGALVAFGFVPLHVACPQGYPASQCSGYNGIGAPTATTSSSGVSSTLFPPTYTTYSTPSSSGMSVNSIGKCSPSTATITRLTVSLGSQSFPVNEYVACGSFSFTTSITASPGTSTLGYCLKIVLGSTVTNPCSRGVSGIVPNPPPTATVVASLKVVVSNYTALFTDTSFVANANVTNVQLVFGDGSTISWYLGGTIKKTYAAQGVYIAQETLTYNAAATSMTAGCSGCTTSVNAAVSISVIGPPSVTPAYKWSTNNLSASFTDLTTAVAGTVVGYAWSFGDGTTGTGYAPSHTFPAAGTYTVSDVTTINGQDGSTITGNATHSVTVQFTVITPSQSTNSSAPPPSTPLTINPIGAGLMLGFGLLIPLAFLPGRWLVVSLIIAGIAGVVGFLFL